ncbi:synaptonemal complex protein 1 [Microcaecilia unicolor]|uniref:Synaptonemal complex protein 1-like n=1 Tax=Microcaecilia unicolor TaxID=1415580 RepID=A0A6P7ZDS4_9AMPH|nr:synaptonemal complex protein 1-like [Microcaecilia unicolor]
MSKLKNDNETELQELKKALESSLMVQKVLEQQVTQEKSQSRALMKEIEMKDSNHGSFKGTIQGLLDEKDHLEKTVKILQENEKELQDITQIREKKIHELEIQITAAAAEHEEHLYKHLAKLKEERDKEMLKYEELTEDYNKVLLEKEQMEKDVDNTFTEVKNLQNSLKAWNYSLFPGVKQGHRCQRKLSRCLQQGSTSGLPRSHDLIGTERNTTHATVREPLWHCLKVGEDSYLLAHKIFGLGSASLPELEWMLEAAAALYLFASPCKAREEFHKVANKAKGKQQTGQVSDQDIILIPSKN